MRHYAKLVRATLTALLMLVAIIPDKTTLVAAIFYCDARHRHFGTRDYFRHSSNFLSILRGSCRTGAAQEHVNTGC